MENRYLIGNLTLKLLTDLARGREESADTINAMVGIAIAGRLCKVYCSEPVNTKNCFLERTHAEISMVESGGQEVMNGKVGSELSRDGWGDI
jgi:hypothetical protein